MIEVPERLAWWRRHPGGAAWLDGLPELVAECARRWGLEVGAPFGGGAMSLTVAVERADGAPAVLKLNGPGSGTEHEAAALRHWDGDGAVLLLAADGGRRALLVERCLPGTPLASVVEEEGARLAIGLLRRLWRPPPRSHPFPLLADEAARWAEGIARDWETLGRPFEAGIVEEAVAACRELAATQPEQVLLHGDFHGGNVLRARRQPWLAIDPVPIVGERAFDAATLLEQPWACRHLDCVAAQLDLDRERLRRWGIVSALRWGISGDKLEANMVDVARRLMRLA